MLGQRRRRSWFATYKTELIDRAAWPTIAKLRTATFDYIEVFYNRKRRHSALGGLSPVYYEKIHQPPPPSGIINLSVKPGQPHPGSLSASAGDINSLGRTDRPNSKQAWHRP